MVSILRAGIFSRSVMDPTRPSTATNGNIPGRTPCTFRNFNPLTL